MMEKIKNNKTVAAVIGLIVLAALIVVLVLSLSSCGKDDAEKPVAENKDAVTETAAPEEKTEDAEPVGTAASGTTGGTADKAPANNAASSGNSGSSNSGTTSNDRNKLEYIMNYDKNVENGVNNANKEFESVINGIGNSFNNGDLSGMANTAQDFMNGVQDYVGSIINTVIP